MATYTVHIPELSTGNLVTDSDRVTFVKDGISWLALVFPLIWLFFYRLWLPLIGYIVVVTSLTLALPETVAGILAFAFNVVLAFEGESLRRWSLRRRGYRLADVVTGASAEECERRFFERWDGHVGIDRRYQANPDQQSVQLTPSSVATHSPAARPAEETVIGLFPDPRSTRFTKHH